MKLTKRWLINQMACAEAVEWYEQQKTTDHKQLLKNMQTDNKPLEWANWVVARKLPRPKKVRYAIYAARQVLDIYESKYPNDKRPRGAIQTAQKYLKNPTKKNAAAYADAAAYTAYTAAYAAGYAYAAAYAAAAAAYTDTAAATANYATTAAYAAAYAADAYTDTAAKKEMQIKIIRYGLKLLGKEVTKCQE